jgi:hypothetical protein
MRKVLIIWALAGALTSCGVIDNPDSSVDPPNIPPSSTTGILVTLKDFAPYAGQQVDMRLVGGDGTVLGLYRIASLALDEFDDYRLEILSVPKKPESRLDLLIDDDGDGVYEAGEPAWSKPLTNGAATFLGSATPGTAPEPEQPGGDFTMSFTGFADLDGELLRLALLNPAGQITGLYTGTVAGDEFDVVLPEMVVNTQPYTIIIFADANGNGRYDAPPADAAWYAYATGDANGITYVFPYNEDFEDVDFEQ